MDIHQKNINFISQQLRKAPVLGGADFQISYFNKGGGTYLYMIETNGGKYLARVNFYEPKNGWGTREQEYKVLQLLDGSGIAPHVYYLYTGNEIGHYDIVDFIEGSQLDAVSDIHVHSLAMILRKLHNSYPFTTSGDTFPPQDELPYTCGVFDEFANGEDKQIEKYDLDGIDDVAIVYNRIKGELGTWFNSLDVFKTSREFCVCHADLKKENILENNGHIYLIDWECAGSDIPETDIGRLFSGCQLSIKQRENFLHTYYGNNISNDTRLKINAVAHILDFFRIIEDFILLKRKDWDANAMIAELQKFEDVRLRVIEA